jgi:hypothetical protein
VKYLVRGYYADDVQPPKVPGELAIEVGCNNESTRDMELRVFAVRPDIGEVDVIGRGAA